MSTPTPTPALTPKGLKIIIVVIDRVSAGCEQGFAALLAPILGSLTQSEAQNPGLPQSLGATL